MIDCSETFQRFYEYLDSELSDPQAREIEEHLKACRKCLERVEFERLFKQFVHDRCTEEVDVRDLKDRIRQKLSEATAEAAPADEELFPNHVDVDPIDDVPLPGPRGAAPVRSRRVPPWSYLLAAAALLLVAISLWPRGEVSPGGWTTDLDLLSVVHAAAAPQFRNQDAAAISNWIQEQGGRPVEARFFERAGCQLRGAAVDSVWSVVFGDAGGVPISLFVSDLDDFPIPDQMVELSIGGRTYFTAQAGDLAVVVWASHENSVVCAAVARADMVELVRFVQRVQAAAREG